MTASILQLHLRKRKNPFRSPRKHILSSFHLQGFRRIEDREMKDFFPPTPLFLRFKDNQISNSSLVPIRHSLRPRRINALCTFLARLSAWQIDYSIRYHTLPQLQILGSFNSPAINNRVYMYTWHAYSTLPLPTNKTLRALAYRC